MKLLLQILVLVIGVGTIFSREILYSFPFGDISDPCQVCHMTAGAYLPVCCNGIQYANRCFAEKCGNLDSQECIEGPCGGWGGGPFLNTDA